MKNIVTKIFITRHIDVSSYLHIFYIFYIYFDNLMYRTVTYPISINQEIYIAVSEDRTFEHVTAR